MVGLLNNKKVEKMNSLNGILGMICTDSTVITDEKMVCDDIDDLPPICYNLELIENEDGTLKWVE